LVVVHTDVDCDSAMFAMTDEDLAAMMEAGQRASKYKRRGT